MASRSLNKVVLLGNLTRDPELKYTPNGTAVCTFGIATNRSWTTNDGQIKEDTQYHRIVAWQKLAELCGKLLTKGKKIYMEGRLTYRNFTGKDGQQRTIAEIVLDDFIMVDGAKRQVTSESTPHTSDRNAQGDSVTHEIDSVEHQTRPAGNQGETSQQEESVNPDDIPF